jgi:hypothetical protein
MAIDTSALNIDFNVLGCSTNCKHIQIADLSNWGPAIMNPSYIDITTPGSTIPVSLLYQKQVINSFNGNNLNLSDVNDYSSLPNLPDGAYSICVRVCMGVDAQSNPIYERVCKYHLQDCQIRCRLAQKLLAIDLACDVCKRDYLNEVLEVQLFLDAAQAQIDNCNVNKAMEYYRRAATELERLKEPGETGRYKSNDCPDCWPGRNMY